MTDRIVVVTGATRGIGLELVRQLAATGDTVVLGARDVDAGEAASAPAARTRVAARSGCATWT